MTARKRSGRAKAAARRRRPPPPGARRERGSLVLVVDDFEDNREMYTQYLRFAGYRVAEAVDGAGRAGQGAAACCPTSSSWTSRCRGSTAGRPRGGSRRTR